MKKSKLFLSSLIFGATLFSPTLLSSNSFNNTADAASASTMKVQKGDTLYSISTKYKINIQDLKNLNHLKSNNILIGQTLKLKNVTSSKMATNKITYKKIVKGDTLYSISKKYKVSQDTLIKLNKLNAKKPIIKIGQTLIISKPTSVNTSNSASAKVSVPVQNSTKNVSVSSKDVKTSKTSYSTTDNLNIRQEPSASSKLLVTIPKGSVITSSVTNGVWKKVSYKGKTGYVHSAYLKKYVASSPTQKVSKAYIASQYKTVRYYSTNIHVYVSSNRADLSISRGTIGPKERLSTLHVAKEKAKSNMGFFNTEKEHIGLYMYDGKYVFNANGNYMTMVYKKDGKIDIRKYTKNMTSAQKNALSKEAIFAVGTSYSLVQDGKINTENASHFDHSNKRNPRTMFGQTADGRFILAVTDGRVASSAGLTATQSAYVMKSLGAVNAVNFDGGGSSELIVNGVIKNKLSDGERVIGSAMFITD